MISVVYCDLEQGQNKAILDESYIAHINNYFEVAKVNVPTIIKDNMGKMLSFIFSFQIWGICIIMFCFIIYSSFTAEVAKKFINTFNNGLCSWKLFA